MLPIAASNLGNPMARVIPTSGAVEANQKGLAPDETHDYIPLTPHRYERSKVFDTPKTLMETVARENDRHRSLRAGTWQAQ